MHKPHTHYSMSPSAIGTSLLTSTLHTRPEQQQQFNPTGLEKAFLSKYVLRMSRAGWWTKPALVAGAVRRKPLRLFIVKYKPNFIRSWSESTAHPNPTSTPWASQLPTTNEAVYIEIMNAKLGIGVHTYKPSTWNAETLGSHVWGQPVLHSETMDQKFTELYIKISHK